MSHAAARPPALAARSLGDADLRELTEQTDRQLGRWRVRNRDPAGIAVTPVLADE